MNILVGLAWAEGDPEMVVDERPDGVEVTVDARLSEAQVDKACAQLGDLGPAVGAAWRARVGLSGPSAS